MVDSGSMNKLTNSYWWKMQWWNFRDRISPKQKWLYSKIPNHWCDKVELTWICLSEMLVHFVEKEEGLESIWGERYTSDPSMSEIYKSSREPVRKELESIYEYIKTDRPLLQKELDGSYPKPIDGDGIVDRFIPILEEDGKTVKHYTMKSVEEIYGMSYEQAYGEVHRLEKLIEDKDTEAMIGIIKNRQYLWT